jgi:hypothetical protein
MASDTDLSDQADTSQQQTPLMKKKSNPIWKVIFILLLIINLAPGLLIWLPLFQGNNHFSNVNIIDTVITSIVFVVIFQGVLAIPNLIAILFYVIIHRPKAVARIISFVILISLILVIIMDIWSIYTSPPLKLPAP